MATWSHQNAYRRKRYLEHTMSRTLVGEQLRGPNAKGRSTCLAESGGSKVRCKLLPIAGTDYCRFHGGKSPQARRHAAVKHNYRKAHELVEKLIEGAVYNQPDGLILPMATPATLGEMLDRATKRDPREVLLQQVHEAASMAAATRELAGDINLADLQDPGSDGHAKAQQTHDLFAEWQVKATKAAKMALDVGIDEQMVRLAEMQAKAMVSVLKRVLATDVLGLSPAQQRVAQALLGQGLRDLIPDVESSPTWNLHVDGEVLPYNAAMDQYAGGLEIVRKDLAQTTHSAGVERRRAETRLARIGRPSE